MQTHTHIVTASRCIALFLPRCCLANLDSDRRHSSRKGEKGPLLPQPCARARGASSSHIILLPRFAAFPCLFRCWLSLLADAGRPNGDAATEPEIAGAGFVGARGRGRARGNSTRSHIYIHTLESTHLHGVEVVAGVRARLVRTWSGHLAQRMHHHGQHATVRTRVREGANAWTAKRGISV